MKRSYPPFIQFILIFIFTFLAPNSKLLKAIDSQESPSLFVGIVIKENDSLIPFFLKTIERLEYDKSKMSLQVNICNTTATIQELVADWALTNRRYYKELTCINSSHLFNANQTIVQKNRLFGEIKNEYLRKGRDTNSDFCCILSSDAFLQPNTLSYLIEKNRPIIAPLLRPTPEAGDPFRNFFGDVSEYGYYKDHPDYRPIAYRHKRGTFNVPCVSFAYVIKTQYVDSLSFTEHFVDWEFLSFSKSAREKKIDQYICNEKEFGFLLHFFKELSPQEEKEFNLVGADLEINPSVLQKIISPHLRDDPSLQSYIDNFNFNEYAIYRVQNRDLFYVDDVKDYIKNYIIKEGLSWEEHIQAQFRKYVKPSSIALDIGGHIGTHTLALSRLVGENGKVYAFEPQSKMFTELAINMYLNKCSNVELHHRALGNEHKLIEMYIPKEEWTERFSPDLVNEGHGTVTECSDTTTGDRAMMVKLDDFELDNVSFIKMDVEGFEMAVIKGGLETIRRNKPVMIIEIFNTYERASRIKQIEDLGYIHSSLGNDDFLFIPLELTSHNTKKEEQESLHATPSLKNEKDILVAWEGSFLDLGSLSHVNRFITDELSLNEKIKLTCVDPITPRTNPPLPSALAKYAHIPFFNPSQNTDITVRHSWPPNWHRPHRGKLVLIQPWEFGAIPEEWVKNAPLVDEFWVPSQFVKNEYVDSGIPSNKVAVIPNGVNPTIFHPDIKPYALPTKKKFKFLFVGGTIYRKGADLLVNTYKNTFSAGDDVSLVIKDFGNNGPYKGQTQEKIIQEAQRTPNAPEIIYLNQDMSYEEIASLYTACDCLVYPYRGEGFALPVLEAMACGLPVVVTANGATDDFVTQDCGWFIPSTRKSIGKDIQGIKLAKDGWMLEPDTEVLSALMKWIAAHPEDAHKKGIAASNYARKEWTWQKAALKAYQRLQTLKQSSTPACEGS